MTRATDHALDRAIEWTNATFTATFSRTVPEPSTYVLLGTGLLAVGGVAARRKRQG